MKRRLFLAQALVLGAALPAAAQAIRLPAGLDPENTLVIELKDNAQVIIKLRPDLAPNHVARIKTLARQGFYNGIVFHRVIEGFMAQTGDPTGTGTGGSPLGNLNAEFSREPFVRGVLGMARAQSPNSANSQFFIMFREYPSLNNQYTVVGQVVQGMEAVDKIKRGEPVRDPDKIVVAKIAADDLATYGDVIAKL